MVKKSGNFKVGIIFDCMELFLYCLSSSDLGYLIMLAILLSCCLEELLLYYVIKSTLKKFFGKTGKLTTYVGN